MSDSTIKQHYVWRYYLTPWTSNGKTDGQIYCLMDNKIFLSALMGIGNQRYFYKVPDFTERQIQLAKLFNERLTTDEKLKKINEKWIDLFQMPLTGKKQFTSSGMPESDVNKFYEYTRNNSGELYHTKIEEFAINQIDLLRSHDCNFINNDEERDRFYFFLANQFTRTKRMKDKVYEGIANDSNKPEGYNLTAADEICIGFFANIFVSTNLGFSLSYKGFQIKFLDNDSELPFITADQPIINVFADYLKNEIPDKFELFYPLTPKLAILVHEKTQNSKNGDTLRLNIEQVDTYNRMIISASLQQIYASDQTVLKRYLSKNKRGAT